MFMLAFVFAVVGIVLFGGLTNPIYGLILQLLGVILFFLGIYFGMKEEKRQNKVIEQRFPSSEYHLEYEITIRGEQIDTTYVLTKIQ